MKTFVAYTLIVSIFGAVISWAILGGACVVPGAMQAPNGNFRH
jgi:hypothetical protein